MYKRDMLLSLYTNDKNSVAVKIIKNQNLTDS